MIKNKMNLKTIFFIIILISLLFPIISYGANFTIGKYKIKNDKYITQIEGNVKIKDFKTNIGSTNIKIYENDKEITNVNQIIKTGMKVLIENKEYTVVVKGDSKGTGKASLTDLISILRHITAQNTERIRIKHPNWILKNENLEAIDFNGDGKIDLTDCISLQKSLLKPKSNNSGNTNTNTSNTNVTNKTEKEVTKITISKTNAELNIGKKLTLTARITPGNATNKSVTWSSSNEKVATVSSGKVTGISEGTTIITVKSSNGLTATCEVKVKPIEVTRVRLSKTIANLYIGDTLELKATISPTTATNKTITWSSDNPKIATVDENGKVIVVGEGTATITVKTANGKTATCKITAKKKIIKASTITLDQTSISLTEGQTLKLNATISPENTTDKTITWGSSNTKVATVDNSGNIKAVSAGTAVITAKTANLKTATCTIKINPSVILATNVTLDRTVLLLDKDHYNVATLKATISPSTTTNKTITWKSSNTKVATVDSKGNIKAKSAGSTTITAKTSNGKTAICKLTVFGQMRRPAKGESTKGFVKGKINASGYWLVKKVNWSTEQLESYINNAEELCQKGDYYNYPESKAAKLPIFVAKSQYKTSSGGYGVTGTKKYIDKKKGISATDYLILITSTNQKIYVFNKKNNVWKLIKQDNTSTGNRSNPNGKASWNADNVSDGSHNRFDFYVGAMYKSYSGTNAIFQYWQCKKGKYGIEGTGGTYNGTIKEPYFAHRALHPGYVDSKGTPSSAGCSHLTSSMYKFLYKNNKLYGSRIIVY